MRVIIRDTDIEPVSADEDGHRARRDRQPEAVREVLLHPTEAIQRRHAYILVQRVARRFLRLHSLLRLRIRRALADFVEIAQIRGERVNPGLLLRRVSRPREVSVVIAGVRDHRRPNRPHVRHGLCSQAAVFDAPDSDSDHCRNDRDNADDHQQFDQSEAKCHPTFANRHAAFTLRGCDRLRAIAPAFPGLRKEARHTRRPVCDAPSFHGMPGVSGGPEFAIRRQ